MRFKIGDIVKDITESAYILYEITKEIHEEKGKIWVKIVELPYNYNGYLQINKVYSDYEHRYKLIKRVYKNKGHLPEWL